MNNVTVQARDSKAISVQKVKASGCRHPLHSNAFHQTQINYFYILNGGIS
jgi:hypothetical protein